MLNYRFLLVIGILLIAKLTDSQMSPFGKIISLQYTYYDIKSCQCQFEPKGGYKYYSSFGPSISIHFPLRKRIMFQYSAGYLKNIFQSNRVDEQFYHSLGDVYYIEKTHYTRNISMDGRIGFNLEFGRFRIIPEMGFSFFQRKNLASDRTISKFTNLSSYSFNRFPSSPPTSVMQYSGEDVVKWSTAALSLGTSTYYKITSRWSIKLSAYRLIASNWYKDDAETVNFFQIWIGIGLDISKAVAKSVKS